jgi:hypothetical protein
MLPDQTECIPGPHSLRTITGDSSNYVVGHTPPVRVFAARPGSLKREALEAESQMARPMKRRCIPKVIQEGFKAQEKILDEGN